MLCVMFLFVLIALAYTLVTCCYPDNFFLFMYNSKMKVLHTFYINYYLIRAEEDMGD